MWSNIIIVNWLKRFVQLKEFHQNRSINVLDAAGHVVRRFLFLIESNLLYVDAKRNISIWLLINQYCVLHTLAIFTNMTSDLSTCVHFSVEQSCFPWLQPIHNQKVGLCHSANMHISLLLVFRGRNMAIALCPNTICARYLMTQHCTPYLSSFTIETCPPSAGKALQSCGKTGCRPGQSFHHTVLWGLNCEGYPPGHSYSGGL